MKKIIYVANIRLPTEKAHGIQIMKMCEAFTSTGYEVELVIPWRFNSVNADPFEYYSIKTKFKITRIFSLDLIRFGRIGFIVQSFTFSLSAFFYTLFKKKDFIFGRDELSLFFLSFTSKVVWETHTGSYNKATKLLLGRGINVVAITRGLKDLYIKNGVNKDKILVAPDSVDAELFDIPLSQSDAREKLGLSKDKKIVLYTGHLYDWKGAHILAQSAKFLSPDTEVVFVGGTENDIKTFTERFGSVSNVLVLGKKPYYLIPIYLKAADVLTLPNSPMNDISSLYTSPMKLFEYMAADRPIVASDLPSIREILNENNSVLVLPDSPELLAEGIKRVFSDNEFKNKIQNQSYEDSKLYTWIKRAKSIMEFID
jgi:glycosyltransferase involved in cell wall biosynthesis